MHFPKLIKIKLESAVIHLFVVFFCHRLSDYPSIIPSLCALIALIKYHSNSLDIKYYDILDIFQTIIRVLNVKSLAQTIRQKVFDLFDTILSSNIMINKDQNIDQSIIENDRKKNENVLKRIKVDNNDNSSNSNNYYDKSNNNDNNDNNNNISSIHIVELFGSEKSCLEVFNGIIHCIEGERDPRCLVKGFQIISKTIKQFSFLFNVKNENNNERNVDDSSNNNNSNNNNSNNHNNDDSIIEKIFDNIACYFPITFIPPEDDTYGVTTEMLIDSLENIFCSHSLFHKHVLPFLIDHLSDETSLGRIQATRFLVRIGSFAEYSPSVFRYIPSGEDSTEGEEHSSIISLLANR